MIRLSAGFAITPRFQFNSQKSTFLPAQIGPRRRNFSRIGSESGDGAAFDSVAYESNRLSLDAAAMENMAEISKKELESDPETDPKAWKWIIRKRMWDLMEARNYAMNPRPVHHRIPNFVGASAAAGKLAELDAFRMAMVVKVNPDSPQKQIRFLTLTGDKKLLTPQPRLRTGFFSVLESDLLKPETINEACTSVGVAKYGRAIGLDEKIKVDLIVIGSVAVNPQTGARLGKGEGFAELEYGMLRYMGAIDDSTLVVTTVHDCQLVDDIPLEKLAIHDVPVDIICTPTRVIFTNTPIPKPQGIYWDKLSPEKLKQIRILRELKKMLEKKTGRKLPTGPSEKLPPTAERKRRKPNCETRKWNVLGEVRVGIFAKENISLRTELAYDYNFEWYGGAKVRCLCGAVACSGFLGAKSRGFQEDTYVWEDGDDRYSVDKIPVYDSAEDELTSEPSKNDETNKNEEKDISKENHSESTALIVQQSDSTPMEEDVVVVVTETVKTESIEDMKLISEDLSQKTAIISRVRDNSSKIKSEAIPKKRGRPFSGGGKTKNVAQKHVDIANVVQRLANKEAQDEVLKYEEVKKEATVRLSSLYDEIRPAIEEHERDSQDSVATSVAEKWIQASCNKLKAEFDLYSSVIKNIACTPIKPQETKTKALEAAGNDDQIKLLEA